MSRAPELVVRVLVVAGLTVDAVVHYRLAEQMGIAAPGGIGGDTLFRVQATAAVLAGLFLLVRGSRLAYVLAGLVALSAFGAVLLYSLVNVPAIGPVPSMYDPFWYPEKTLSAVAEAVAVLGSIVGLRVARRRRRALTGQ
ncbi:hypothetical protein IM660_16415 [Ruania alkalisoli]|uniref:Uncharacterized protein n=1 Tax=Ruania alkalisoli TaxID=2779775 RepID=A0A7M1SSQ6_9MICO|nr:hypothetical protein [Ruania alkalisoli]QOR70177.1 hypothetical protein IM660_16415 [Ruania alkalisoli]